MIDQEIDWSGESLLLLFSIKMARVIIKKERSVEVDGKKRKISSFDKHYVDSDKDFSCKYGTIKKTDLKKDKVKVANEEFVLFDAQFIDDYKRLRRDAQIITLKDIASIIANTCINKKSKVIDAGAGSGALACFLAAVADKVESFDINMDSLKIARENAKQLDLENIKFTRGDVYNAVSIKLKGFDVFTLDVPEPWRAIKTAGKVLKVGGFLVSYSPNINQTQQLVNALPDNFLHEKTIEVIEREWSVKDLVLRPKTKDVGHTAFLTFVRKIGK